MTWTRNKQETLTLPIDALALLILDDYRSRRGLELAKLDKSCWARRDSARSGGQCRPSGGLGVAHDARSCLRDPSQHSADAYRVTLLGEQTLQYGLARLAAAERLGVTTLHSRIGQRVEQQFLLG
jgi:hypothetical protein